MSSIYQLKFNHDIDKRVTRLRGTTTKLRDATVQLQGVFTNLLQTLANYKAAAFGSTIALTNDVSNGLQEWADVLKGKDRDPDSYFPTGHFRMIYAYDNYDPRLVDQLAAIGKGLREKPRVERVEALRQQLRMSPLKMTKPLFRLF